MSSLMNDVISTENLLGYRVTTATAPAIVDDVVRGIRSNRGPRWLACLNPHSYASALNDNTFRQALLASDLLVADGVGVVIASRWLGGNVTGRVTGSDVFFGVNAALDKVGGGSVFFLGSTEECLRDIEARFKTDYPNLRFAGGYSPPFKPEWSSAELDAMRDAIRQANADVLWVGMTAPKQEKWIFENLPHLNVKFAGAIGAVFDFYTGRVKRSSPIFQRLGLEWLPRLVQQPRRLWRRMFVSAPIFVWHTLRERSRLATGT